MDHEPELTLDRDALNPPLDTAAKRALIETELRKDAGRSDREIARIIGCDHKTVGAARERLGLASPLGNSAAPTATEQRHMLIEGCKDFDKRYPPGPSDVTTADEAVDEAIAKGAVNLSPEHRKMVDIAMDHARGIGARLRDDRQDEVDLAGQKNGERTVLAPRKEVTIQHDEGMGEWIIRQRNWPDEDGVVIIDDEDIHPFIDILTDHLGYGRAPGYGPVR